MITSTFGLGGDGNGELGVDKRLAVGDDDADVGHQRSVASLFLETSTHSFASHLHTNCITYSFHDSYTNWYMYNQSD